MENALDFNSAARRALFGEEKPIPGHGSSAAKAPARHTRKKITINLDSDLIEHFKALSLEEGRGYQQLINDALREYVEGTSSERLAREVGEMLLNDPSFISRVTEAL